MSQLPTSANWIKQLLEAMGGRQDFGVMSDGGQQPMDEQSIEREMARALGGPADRYDSADVFNARRDLSRYQRKSEPNWARAAVGGLPGLALAGLNKLAYGGKAKQAQTDLDAAIAQQDERRQAYYNNRPETQSKPSAFGEKANMLEEMLNTGQISQEQYQDTLMKLFGGGGGQNITVETGGGPGEPPKVAPGMQAVVEYGENGKPFWKAQPVPGSQIDKERREEQSQLVSSMVAINRTIQDPNFPNAVGPIQGSKYAQGFNAMMDNDVYKKQRSMQREVGMQVLNLGQRVLKGSQTEGEWKKIAENFPGLEDHPSVWMDWQDSALDVIKRGSPEAYAQIMSAIGSDADATSEPSGPEISPAALQILERNSQSRQP